MFKNPKILKAIKLSAYVIVITITFQPGKKKSPLFYSLLQTEGLDSATEKQLLAGGVPSVEV